MIRFCSLASSSSGNALYIDAGGTELLIDAGLNYKALNARLKSVGKYLMNISAVFVTHEHGDHNKSVPLIAINLPGVRIYSERAGNISHGVPVICGTATVTPFRLSHDEPCHGYIIQDTSGNKLAVIADTGTLPCESLGLLLDCQAIVIEMNHDTELLVSCGFYPADLQERIFSDVGHLRNEQARHLLELVAWPGLEMVMPYHLSENCNNQELARYEAYAGVQKEAPGCQVVCAEKSRASEFCTLI
ncbi:MAG: MBL fold metallo-hydrolase [Desulfurivibrionaceae bacterium]|nr:MBL fold metallo-hydrolase [Desulfurivibrionaceae bacterium]